MSENNLSVENSFICDNCLANRKIDSVTTCKHRCGLLPHEHLMKLMIKYESQFLEELKFASGDDLFFQAKLKRLI